MGGWHAAAHTPGVRNPHPPGARSLGEGAVGVRGRVGRVRGGSGGVSQAHPEQDESHSKNTSLQQHFQF